MRYIVACLIVAVLMLWIAVSVVLGISIVLGVEAKLPALFFPSLALPILFVIALGTIEVAKLMSQVFEKYKK